MAHIIIIVVKHLMIVPLASVEPALRCCPTCSQEENGPCWSLSWGGVTTIFSGPWSTLIAPRNTTRRRWNTPDLYVNLLINGGIRWWSSIKIFVGELLLLIFHVPTEVHVLDNNILCLFVFYFFSPLLFSIFSLREPIKLIFNINFYAFALIWYWFWGVKINTSFANSVFMISIFVFVFKYIHTMKLAI